MKYPQLVPTRAVNAISDWLVSRLEQLGVDCPHIYTRLLLSLLQSTVQMNDPNEFNNLESFFTNRKGQNRRYLECDTDTLKKLHAVQCLQEIVTGDQDISTIEDLVDDLVEKLKDIEKKNGDSKDGDNVQFLNKDSYTLSGSLEVRLQSYSSFKNHHVTNIQKHHKVEKKSKTNIENDSQCEGSSSFFESDPKKRYFRAFPALSKEMEESFFAWRRNAKSLTWPADPQKIIVLNKRESDHTLASKSYKTTEGFERQIGRNVRASNYDAKYNSSDNVGFIYLESSYKNNGVGTTTSAAANGGVKRKTKRRRNQAIPKGKPIENSRKNWNNIFVSNDNCLGKVGGHGKSKNRQRSSSPNYWDTQFEGCWEMGPDLIKDFLAKQNKDTKKRCRSKSESGAHLFFMSKYSDSDNGEKENLEVSSTGNLSSLPTMPPVDISFCCEGDTLNSLSEAGSDVSIFNGDSQKRLYERDGSLLNDVAVNRSKIDESDVDINDFARLKAKFNSSVEALWKTSKNEEAQFSSKRVENLKLVLPSPSSNIAPNVAPFRENLRNFWSNYFTSQTRFEKKYDDCSCLSLSNNTYDKDVNCGSGYFSMPNKVGNYDETKEISSCLLFEDSIWSNNQQNIMQDSNESFGFKIWNSINANNNNYVQDNKKMEECGNNVGYMSNTYCLPLYNGSSKWSEGINAGPYAFQNNHTLSLLMENSNSSLGNQESTDSSTTISSAWQTPIFSNQLNIIQPNLQPWTQSNSIASANNFEGGSDITDSSSVKASNLIETITPPISLANHSSTSSGFVEYSKVKTLIKPYAADLTLQRQRYTAHLMLRPKDIFPDDENLLTSQRTHFNPINSFIDGHSFEISSALDTIEFDRSPSGGLYIDDDKYVEYIRNDIIVGEEDTVMGILGAAAMNVVGTPLYASSNCEAAYEHKKAIAKRDNFVVRFAIRNCEVACQTDDKEIFNCSNQNSKAFSYDYYKSKDEKDNSQPLFIVLENAECNVAPEICNAFNMDPIEAEHNTPHSIESWKLRDKHLFNINMYREGSDDCLSLNSIICNNNTEKKCNYVSDQENEIDECFNLEKKWSISEIDQQCFFNGHKYINNQHNDSNDQLFGLNDNSNDALDINHSLWEMCAACNNEYKSKPANRMLQDEWQLDADEIMNNLNNMQDLYIADDVENLFEYNTANCEKQTEVSIAEPADDENLISPNKPKPSKQDSLEAQAVIQRVNRLIVDLLRPENQISSVSSKNSNNEEEKTLWIGNLDEQNIWQESNKSDVLKPFELLRHFTSDEVEDNDKNVKNDLQWEHSYLADLWRQNTPCLLNEKQRLPFIKNNSFKNFSNVSEPVSIKPNLITSENANFFDDGGLCDRNNGIFASERRKSDLSKAASTEEYNKRDPVVAFKRLQQFINLNISSNSSSKLKFGNRKRRHSASQNYFYQHSLPTTKSYASKGSYWLNNNNNTEVVDLNSFQFDLKNLACKKTNNKTKPLYNKSTIQNRLEPISAKTIDNSSVYQICEPKQTIITCQYWASVNQAVDNEKDSFRNFKNRDIEEEVSLSCLVNDNCGILRHMAMLSRPLTR